MKKIFSIVFAIVLIFSMVSFTDVFAEDVQIAKGTCGENLTWVLYDNGELIIDGTGEMVIIDFVKILAL